MYHQLLIHAHIAWHVREAAEQLFSKFCWPFRAVGGVVLARSFCAIFGIAFSTLLGATPSQAQTFGNAGAWSYTVPAGVNTVQVQVAGAGGGGGGADSRPGGNGGKGVVTTAVIRVTAGQILSGTIGAGGTSGYGSGAAAFGFIPCSGAGAGGTGLGAGGNGGVTNCLGLGSSGGGGGGGGATTIALAGTTLIQAGGGGGGGGGGFNADGGTGGTNSTLLNVANCGANGVGSVPVAFLLDGGGGGGGGGGYTGGTAGIGNLDNITATGGFGGTSCRSGSAAITSLSSNPNGPAGASGGTVYINSPGPAGDTGYVIISTAALSVAKQSDVVSDPVNLTVQPKAIPGAVIGYCVTISNTWIVAANNVIITDPIPVDQSYVSGSVYVGSTCLNAATVPPTATFINNTLTITSLSLAAGATYAAIFRVVVN